MASHSSYRSACLLGIGLAFAPPATAQSAREPSPPPADIIGLFSPPPTYRNDLGSFRSPLLFADGKRVQTAADWPRRRAEILSTWHRLMGPWPALIENPRVETIQTTRRDNVVQHQLRIEVALGNEMV